MQFTITVVQMEKGNKKQSLKRLIVLSIKTKKKKIKYNKQ